MDFSLENALRGSAAHAEPLSMVPLTEIGAASVGPTGTSDAGLLGPSGLQVRLLAARRVAAKPSASCALYISPSAARRRAAAGGLLGRRARVGVVAARCATLRCAR